MMLGVRLSPARLCPYPSLPAGVLIPLAEISNFTDREGNDVREAPHHSPR